MTTCFGSGLPSLSLRRGSEQGSDRHIDGIAYRQSGPIGDLDLSNQIGGHIHLLCWPCFVPA